MKLTTLAGPVADAPLNLEAMTLAVAFLIAVAASAWFLRTIRKQPIEIETNWGGLGGGGGGWRASDSLVAVVAMVLAWLLLGALSIRTSAAQREAIDHEADRAAKMALASASAAATPAPTPKAAAPALVPVDAGPQTASPQDR
jgi:hypothetical protein